MEKETKEVITMPELSNTTVEDVLQQVTGKMTPAKAKKAQRALFILIAPFAAVFPE